MNLPFKMIVENEIEQWRASSFFSKEPETLEWIADFKKDAIFFDIGSNIGLYALYCATLYPNSLIFAFEPVPCNYIRLLQNIALNGFDNIIALPLGMSGITRLDVMYEISNEIGHSGSLINNLPEKEIKKSYLVPATTVDDFVRTWNIFPNHIKIDIDAGEHDVIVGGYLTLLNRELESCLIEVNDHKKEIVQIFDATGFTLDNRFNDLLYHSRYRRKNEEGNTAENVIFTRREI